MQKKNHCYSWLPILIWDMLTAKYARDLIASGAIEMSVLLWQNIRRDGLHLKTMWVENRANGAVIRHSRGGVNCLGDLGTHVENAVATMTGLKIRRLLAKMDVIVPGRKLDDNDSVLIEFDNGATGIFWTLTGSNWM